MQLKQLRKRSSRALAFLLTGLAAKQIYCRKRKFYVHKEFNYHRIA